MLFYHATDMKNLGNILGTGIKPNNIEKVIYLTKSPEDSAKFLAIRGHKEIVSLAVELDENEVQESYDHSFSFFKCKAYTYDKDIPLENINLDLSRKYVL